MTHVLGVDNSWLKFALRVDYRCCKSAYQPNHLRVERIGRLWYVILPDEEPSLRTVGYARVSSHEQKSQLGPQANRLWASA